MYIISVNEAIEQTSYYDKILLDMFLNPEKIDKTEEIKILFSSLIKTYFASADMATAYPNLFKLLWYSNIPCFKNNVTNAYLLKKCIWQGVEYNCSDLFQQVPTDSGFNWMWTYISQSFDTIFVNRNVLCF